MKRKPYQNNTFRLFLLVLIFLASSFIGLKVFNPTPKTVKTVPAEVLLVLDGDTIEARVDGKKERVRLIGIDAPEMGDEGEQPMCFAKEAYEKAKELLDGKTIRFESDPTQGNRDKYERLLRYVYLEDGTNVNTLMIAKGFARQYLYRGIPYQYQKEFQQAEQDAQNKKLGLWADGACPVPQ